MRKSKPSLYLRFRTPDNKQSAYCPALFDHKSRIRPFWCLVKGVEEFHRDGTYYRRVKRDGKWKWESLGKDANTASAKSCAKPIGSDKTVGQKEPEAPRETEAFRIGGEIDIYMSNVSKLARKTYKTYKRSLELFRQSCKKLYVHQITKQDLQAFDSSLMEGGNEDRTRYNRMQHVITFLRNREGRRLGPPINDVSITVKYVEAPPEAYTRQELEALFHVSKDDEKFLWRFFLGTGFREGEVSVTEITDVNRDTKTIRVDEKSYFGFKPKDCEKRNVPISDSLIAEIEARSKSGSSSLLFGNNGRLDGYLRRRLKQVAFSRSNPFLCSFLGCCPSDNPLQLGREHAHLQECRV
jgi:hypothetical protein